MGAEAAAETSYLLGTS